jgi:rhodanese-related sulfurtransferase
MCTNRQSAGKSLNKSRRVASSPSFLSNTRLSRNSACDCRQRTFSAELARWIAALIPILAISTPLGTALAQANIQNAVVASPQRTSEVSTDELRRIIGSGGAILLDARPFMEFAVGHIPGALNVSAKPGVPMSQYVSDVTEVDRLARGDRSRPLVLYCNGPFCGKSNRLANELLQAGFTDVRRYQLGTPVWRALGGVMQIEAEGFAYIQRGDQTARIYDARPAGDFASGSVSGAINLPKDEVDKAKDDGRLPMQDHNTRIVVFAGSAEEARSTAERIARNAFHNVMFCAVLYCGQQMAGR